MPRVIKHPEERRAELLAIAARLFAEKGYEATSVDEIIDAANLSKGAFYHHFPAKEALLEAMAARAAEAALARLAPILSARDRDARQRLEAFFAGGRDTGDVAASLALFATIYRPENALLFQRMQASVGAVIVPVLAEIIAEGMAAGLFARSDPQAVAEAITLLGGLTRNQVATMLAAEAPADKRAALDDFTRRLAEQGILIDRMLGLKPGTLIVIDQAYEMALARALGLAAPT